MYLQAIFLKDVNQIFETNENLESLYNHNFEPYLIYLFKIIITYITFSSFKYNIIIKQHFLSIIKMKTNILTFGNLYISMDLYTISCNENLLFQNILVLPSYSYIFLFLYLFIFCLYFQFFFFIIISSSYVFFSITHKIQVWIDM